MNNITPAHVRAARITRLALEAYAPVYSTSTPAPKRKHVTMIEIQDGYGRRWVGPFEDAASQRKALKDAEDIGYSISDIDCSVKCWCVKR